MEGGRAERRKGGKAEGRKGGRVLIYNDFTLAGFIPAMNMLLNIYVMILIGGAGFIPAPNGANSRPSQMIPEY